MDELRELATGRNIALYPENEETLRRVANVTGLRSMSAAARFIIADWEKIQLALVASGEVDPAEPAHRVVRRLLRAREAAATRPVADPQG